MLLVTIAFLTFLAAGLVLGSGYVATVWVVRNRPDSPLGSVLKDLPLYRKYTQQGVEEAEAIQRSVRDAATPKAARSKYSRRRSFRDAQAPDDSMKVTFPDTGEELNMRVVGTLRMNELFQRDDSRRDNPWYSTPSKFVFQILKGRRDAWVMELPGGRLALVTEITEVADSTVQRFVPLARSFGSSQQSATDIELHWKDNDLLLWDIGRLGLSSAAGETPEWDICPEDPGRQAWDDGYTVKFILAGPNGGKSADHESGEQFLCVITPVVGTGGYVLTGNLIDEKYLVIQEEA